MDIDGDGDQDLIYYGHAVDGLKAYINQGNKRFVEKNMYSTFNFSLKDRRVIQVDGHYVKAEFDVRTVLDVDGDGLSDLLVTVEPKFRRCDPQATGFQVRLVNGGVVTINKNLVIDYKEPKVTSTILR